MKDSYYFEDLEVGASWTSNGRTITETDVVNFAGMSGDFTPIHMDREHAENSPFGRPVAHGLLGLSILAGLSSTCPLVHTVAFVGMREWQFVKPIYFGDTVHVVTTLQDKERQGRRRGIAVWFRKLVNQHGEVVQQGEFTTLIEAATVISRPKPTHVAATETVPRKVAG